MPSGRRHYRVTLTDALQAHEEALRFGGRPGILDLGRIEAAVARPYSGYHRSLASKAAALFEAIATNHGFVDGNKRTAIYVTYLLIRRSRHDFWPQEGDPGFTITLEDLAVAVAKGEMRLPEITAWFAKRIIRDTGEVW